MALTPRVLNMADTEQDLESTEEKESAAEESLEEVEEAESTDEVVEDLEKDAEPTEPIPVEDQGEMTELEIPEEATSVEGDQESYSPLEESEVALRTDEDDFGYRLGGFGDSRLAERANEIKISMCRVAVQSQLRGVTVIGGVRFEWPDPMERLMKIHETDEAWTVPDNTVIISIPLGLALDAVKSRQAVIVADLPDLVLSSYGDDNENYNRWGDYESQYVDQGFFLTIEQFEALKKNKKTYAKKAKAQAA